MPIWSGKGFFATAEFLPGTPKDAGSPIQKRVKTQLCLREQLHRLPQPRLRSTEHKVKAPRDQNDCCWTLLAHRSSIPEPRLLDTLGRRRLDRLRIRLSCRRKCWTRPRAFLCPRCFSYATPLRITAQAARLDARQGHNLSA